MTRCHAIAYTFRVLVLARRSRRAVKRETRSLPPSLGIMPTCAAPATVSKRMTKVMLSAPLTTVPAAWEGRTGTLVSPDTGHDGWERRTGWFRRMSGHAFIGCAPVLSRLRGSWRGVPNWCFPCLSVDLSTVARPCSPRCRYCFVRTSPLLNRVIFPICRKSL